MYLLSSMKQVQQISSVIFFFLVFFVGGTLFSQEKYMTLGYRSCGTGQATCHASDYNWWKDDAHFSTRNDIKRKEKNSKKYAQLYGINPDDYLRGNSICAKCHGEVVSGKESKRMNTGVSCESCHGPAGPKTPPNAGYFEVHQEGDPPSDPLSENRSGYQKALKVGLVKLHDVNTRANICVDCHQIDDKRLLETGHPSGEGFDYVKGIKNAISKHWDYKLRRADINPKPFNKAVAMKPIPPYEVKSPNAGVTPVDVNPLGPVQTRTIIIYRDPEVVPWLNPKRKVKLEPFDFQVSDSTSVEEILRMIKKRIETIHKKISDKE